MIHFFLVILLIVSIGSAGQISPSTKDITNSQNTNKQVSPCFDDYIPLEPPDVILDPQPDSPFETVIPLEGVIN